MGQPDNTHRETEPFPKNYKPALIFLAAIALLSISIAVASIVIDRALY